LIVKKSTRDKRVWIQKQCTNVEQNHTDGKEREAYKLVKELTGSIKGVAAKVVKDAQGTLLTKQDDILKCWTDYVKNLYSRHDTEDNPGDSMILREEVEQAIKKLKRPKKFRH